MKRYFFWTIQFVGISLLVFLSIELFLRGAGIQSTRYTHLDPKLGIAYRPEAEYIQYTEGFSFGKINQDGLRGPEVMDKYPHVERIALVGDSYTAGFQVWERHHFRTLLQKALNQSAKGGKQYELLNLAMEGYDFGQMYMRFMMQQQRWKPDLTLFLLQEGDIQFKASTMNPYVRLQGDSLVSDTSFRSGPSFRRRYQLNDNPLYNSSLFQLLGNANILRQGGKLPEIVLGKLAGVLESNDPVVSSASSQHESASIWDNHQDSLMLALTLRQLAKQNVAFVTFHSLPLADQIRIEGYGIPVYDMGPYLEEMGGHNLRTWKVTQRTGHYNYAGHEAIAAYLLAHVAWP
jgi:hypothetical protein